MLSFILGLSGSLFLLSHGYAADTPLRASPADTGKVSGRGSIVTLAMGYDDLLQYNATLLQRNRSIRDHLYTCNQLVNDKCTAAVADVIIFHEGNIIQSHQDYIQLATPEMPINFINVSSVFQQFHHVSNPLCPPSYISSLKYTSAGYHSMCYFWFMGFIQYVEEYDWMLRIDSDCILMGESRNAVNNLHNLKVNFSATSWLSLDREKYDTISDKKEGPVVRGLKNLTQSFAIKHGITRQFKTWKAPYSNVMYIDLKHLRNSVIIAQYMEVVNASGCIYGNRWGDLPLWGAAIRLNGQPTTKLNLKYYHGSHNIKVE